MSALSVARDVCIISCKNDIDKGDTGCRSKVLVNVYYHHVNAIVLLPNPIDRLASTWGGALFYMSMARIGGIRL